MEVSKKRGTPKSSILIKFSMMNHPFWGTLLLGNLHMVTAISGSSPGVIRHTTMPHVAEKTNS
jgi:hypothetical protein